MTRRVRLLSVATVCLVLLGVATVATRAPDPADELARAGGQRDGGSDGEKMDATSESTTPGVESPEDSDRRSKGGDSAKKAVQGSVGVDRGNGAATTTTGVSGHATTTTLRKSATTTTTTRPNGSGCPNPKTCDVYKLIDQNSGGPQGGTKGWRPEADGVVRMKFYVNPAPPQNSGLTENTLEAAFLEATDILERANPRVKFVYKGRTTRIPASFDGFNDFAFGDRAVVQHDGAGHIREADIRSDQFVTAGDWAYTPCEQRDGSCGDSGSGKGEIMSMIVHEMTHTLGLADLFTQETSELTMHPGGPSDRKKVTLGLGDVLGIRALYPTSASMPPIYSP